MAAPGLSNAWIVPGLKVVRDDHVDVMRGEEVQAFGALTLSDTASGLCCLPGTHSKWVRLEQERLTDFTTAMTGELFHAVRFHTLPGEPSRERAAFDESGFRQDWKPRGIPMARCTRYSRHAVDTCMPACLPRRSGASSRVC
ncbi:2-keto-3-deoxy-galactonokinase [Halomonas elongata]|uniref:2-keto-3-deoxy-galactonokinase n=1 Tax=Halomonas elongata TaxID=2746 RepID=A0A1B8P5H7_HALEL|nr:2-keto-3-deoxy-galactonokinase [Halomonas elongata]